MAVATGTALLAGSLIAGATAAGTVAYSSSQQKKAQKAAQDFAQQQQEVARDEQARLEEKYGLTPGELAAYEGRTTEAQRRAGISGEDLLSETGPTTKALIEKIGQRLGMSGEELFRSEGELAKQTYDEATSSKPTAMFEGELELARQMVNAEANRRGVFGGLPEGGVRFEQLGRAGVDLAIKSARERLAQRNAVLNSVLGLSGSARSEAGIVGERALTESQRARAELDQILSGAKNREAGIVGVGENVLQRGTATSADIMSSIYGQQVGEAVDTKQAGLEQLGKSVGNLFDYLSTEKTSTTPALTSDELLNYQQKRPFQELEERSGKIFSGG